MGEPILANWIIFMVLSPKSNEQEELMKELMQIPRKKLEAVEKLKNLVKDFQTKKLIPWPLSFEKELLTFETFADKQNGKARFEMLRKRVVQHNIRIVSLYYRRVTIKRLTSLLTLTQKELETEL